ncbi:TSG6 protein, partial [Atractosteus spatula]|nr:TSG6 protein [Atractosteus spatula]
IFAGRVAGVFHYDRNIRYSLTFQQAQQACEKDFAASLADRMQLFTAYQQGLEECRAGWISSAEVAYPRVHKNWNCGQNHTDIITYGIRENLLERWDVFCYKKDNNCSVYPTQVSCGGVLQGDKGEFQSPGFPQSYPSNMDCTWEVTAPPGHLILLAFHSVVLEEHKGCQYDFVTVFDGKREEGVELGRFCGSELPPPLRSSSNTMTVQLRSDASVELDGFSVRFHSVKPPSRDESSLDECEVKWGRECSTTERAAIHCQVTETCSILRSAGVLESGTYVIDPDGEDQGVEPFPVFCDMNSLRADGVTVVGHDSESRTRVSPCEEAGCYSRQITYRQASLLQLRSLIQASESCTQLVKVMLESCAALKEAGFVESRRYIIDPDGPGQGLSQFEVYCDMASDPLTGTCFGMGRLCNCDSNDHVWRMDEGFLRDKNLLPVKAVYFGDTKDAPLEMAFHTVGKLTCKGKSKVCFPIFSYFF